MNKFEKQLRALPEVVHVDDEREIENSIIVMLKDEFEFVADPGCGTRGFDSFIEALRECRTGIRVKAKRAGKK